jgi:hypothetical protein
MALSIVLRSRGARPTTTESRALSLIRSKLEKYETYLRHVDVQLSEARTRRDGIEQACRIDVQLLDAPTFYVEASAPRGSEAAELAADAVEGAVAREVKVVEQRTERARKHKGERLRARRLGRKLALGREAAEEVEVAPVLAPPPSGPRDLPTPRRVRTAHPRRGKKMHQTRTQSGATSAREPATLGRPSRKSTRKSANRSKRDSNLARRATRGVRSPEARAAAEA